MLELLAPAGSAEAVSAAVQNGADAVYLGYGDFHARRNAKNFSDEEFAAAVSYCHLRGVKVYLTLNTLLSDRELEGAAAQAAAAATLGVDAVLVQDLGVLRMLRHVAPSLPAHASTQMTVHSLDGVKQAADLGLTRVVLARELSREALEYICLHAPIEIEVFAHGALCMCYSGQCFFSSVLGTRSGSRGLCAQPCRLKYGWGKRADSYPLSPKDLSLISYLQELRKMGVSCVKLEGRMKRSEYVAVVTGIYARALREEREPNAEELQALHDAFSRDGFTQGYYLDQKGPDMFGTRAENTPEPKELFAAARRTYTDTENPLVPVRLYAMIRPDEPARVAAEDDLGHVATAEGPVPEAAQNVPLTAEAVQAQLSRTGGTPYRAEKLRCLVEPGLSLPLSALNALRRSALDGLSAQRTRPPARETNPYQAGVRYPTRKEPPELTISLRRASQVTPELLDLRPAILYLPLDELAAHPEKALRTPHTAIGVTLPRILWDRELPDVLEKLAVVRERGVRDALLGSLQHLGTLRDMGFTLRGDFGLGVYNAQTLKELKHLGFTSATLSFELKFPQIRDLTKAIDTELVVYGRLPLMITENCIIKNYHGHCNCDNENTLTDQKGMHFPVLPAPGCRNEIFNSQTLFLADKAEDYRHLGLWGARLFFTTESPHACVQVTQRYLNQARWSPGAYTRGLYYRNVE
ncbi:MAG: DUF3656 domain-containing protein [Oscillospiraceae bacterium]|nr:DUF3656 domain-containing protein [Oscillospiraceae bacterium]